MLFRSTTMDFLRGVPEDQPRNAVASRIYTLPVSLGGCGIASHVEIRHAARSASREESCHFLVEQGVQLAVPLHAHGPDPMDAPAALPARVPSQHTRVREIHRNSLPAFLATLTEEQRVCFVDNGSQIGSAWLHAVPHGKFRALSATQVRAALSIRCLDIDPLGRTHCPHCNADLTLHHFEGCAVRRMPIQERHTWVRDAIGSGIQGGGDRLVQFEPTVTNNPLRRADIRVGTVARGLGLDPEWGLMDLKIKWVLA